MSRSGSIYYDVFDEAKLAGSDEEGEIRVNFFLTKVQQKQRTIQYIYGDDAYGVYFSKDELKDILGQKTYTSTIDTLIEAGVVTLSDTELSSKYGYRLWIFDPIDYIPTATQVPVSGKYPRVINSLTLYYDRKHKELTKEGRIQLGNLRHTTISISQLDFNITMVGYYPEYVRKCKFEGREPLTRRDYMDVQAQLYNRIQDFNEAKGRQYYDYVTEDVFGGRFHSIITQLPKVLKEQGVIKINGNDTVELDLHQSQITILSELLNSIQPGNDFSTAFNAQEDMYLYIKERLGLQTRYKREAMLRQ